MEQPQLPCNQAMSSREPDLAEGFGDVGLQLPVNRPPDLQAVVVRLRRNVLPHRVPR